MPIKGGKGKKKSKNAFKNSIPKELVTKESVTKNLIDSGLQENNTLFYGYIEQIYSGSAIEVVYYPDKDITKTSKVRVHVKISFVKQRVVSKGANVLIALREFNRNEADLLQVYDDNTTHRIEFFRELNKTKNSNYKGVVFISDLDATDISDPAAMKQFREQQREQRRAKSNAQEYVNFDELIANPNKPFCDEDEEEEDEEDEEDDEKDADEDDTDIIRNKKEKTLDKKNRYNNFESDFL